MSGKASFDQLATEIFFEIFEYLSHNDIIYAFFYLNERFNSMLLQHDRFLNHFTTPTCHFSFWQNLLPIISSRIEHLFITTPDFSLSLDLFPNLKSVVVSSSYPIDKNELNFIYESKQFNKLLSLKIKGEIYNPMNTHQGNFIEKIFSTKNCLNTYEYLPIFYQSLPDVNNVELSLNLRSLSLKLYDCKYVSQLLYVTPNLKDLNLSLFTLSNFNEEFYFNEKFSPVKLEKLSLVVESNKIYDTNFFNLTSSFLKHFSSSLIYLSLDFHRSEIGGLPFDGDSLEQKFLHSMIELKSFHLYISLGQCIFDVKSILSSFQSQFYMDHHWTFAIHGYLKKCLFTLPFHFDKLGDFIDFYQIKSSNSNVLNSLHTWSHVKSIDFCKHCLFEANQIEEIQLKMPKLPSATFKQTSASIINQINLLNISFHSINTLSCQGDLFEKTKHILPRFFPNIRSLILSFPEDMFPDSSTKTNSNSFTKLEHVKIVLERGDVASRNLDEILGSFLRFFCRMSTNIHSVVFHFFERDQLPLYVNTTIRVLETDEFAQNYQIKIIYNNLVFLRKVND